MRRLSCRISVAALCGGLLLGHVAFGQEEGRPRESRTQDGAGRTAVGAEGQRGAPVSDRFLATWLIQDNRLEIATSELAREKAENDKVREFAGRMVDKHTALIGKLEAFAGRDRRGGEGGERAEREGGLREEAREAGRELAGEVEGEIRDAARGVREAAEEARPDREREPRRAGERGRGRGGEGAVLALRRELGRKMLESAREALGDRQGANFDIAYVTMQVAAHETMLDTLQVFQDHASPELHELLTSAEEATEQHLKQARQLFETIDRQEN